MYCLSALGVNGGGRQSDAHRTERYGGDSWQLPGGCCICLEQSAGVSTRIAVTASLSQQTEDRAFCPVVQLD